jgi:predicted N-acetyltransferase YhbS
MSHALALTPDPSSAAGRIASETEADTQGVEALLMAAFGPGRFAKTAERLREGSRPAAGFVVRRDERIVGSVRLWPVIVGQTPALFLGPIAVDATRRSGGLGAELVQACLEHAQTAGVGGVLLVGDQAYFDRFGFAPAQRAVLPGPVDQRRVLWLDLGAGAAEGRVAIA